MSKGVLYFLLTIFSIPLFSQNTVTLNPVKDNTLYESASGSTSNGAGIYLFVGKTNQTSTNLRRAVIKFDLAGTIPANSVVTSAKLVLNMSRTATGTSNISVYRLLEDWGEGTSDAGANEGKGAAASTNDATWIHSFFNTKTWLTVGGTFNQNSSATTSVGSIGSYEWSSSNLAADVNAWLVTPDSNYGWIIIGDETNQSAKRFDSRQNSVAANRPKLILSYEPLTTVRHSVKTPGTYLLSQNYPNPFNPSTTISYSIPADQFITIRVSNILGQTVHILYSGIQRTGSYTLLFNGHDLPSGLYFYSLETPARTLVKKMILTK